MLSIIDKLGAFIKQRALRCDVSLSELGLDAERVATRVGCSELFCNLDNGLLHELLEAMEVVSVNAGKMILRQGEKSDAFIVLASGEAVVSHTGDGGEGTRVLATLSEPTGLGEEALLGSEPRTVSVEMKSSGTLLRMRRDAFAAFVGARAVKWVESGEKAPKGKWVWVGDERYCPNSRANDTVVVALCHLRERIVELAQDGRYLCCSRGDKDSAIAAFVMQQRGFDAYAVRDGRKAIGCDG